MSTGKPIAQTASNEGKGGKRLAKADRSGGVLGGIDLELRYYSHGVKTTKLIPLSGRSVIQGPPKGTKSKIHDNVTLRTSRTVRTEADSSVGFAGAILGVTAGAKAKWTDIEELR